MVASTLRAALHKQVDEFVDHLRDFEGEGICDLILSFPKVSEDETEYSERQLNVELILNLRENSWEVENRFDRKSEYDVDLPSNVPTKITDEVF